MKKVILIITTVFFAILFSAFHSKKEYKCQPAPQCKPMCAIPELDLAIGCQKVAHVNPELVYKVEHRFMTTITKSQLQSAHSLEEIIPEEALKDHYDFANSTVAILLENDKEKLEAGNSLELNESQVNLLRQADYSTNLRVSTKCKKTTQCASKSYDDLIIYYVTVIPEQEAAYKGGNDAFAKKLRAYSQDHLEIIEQDKLKPGQVSFEIQNDGTIKDVNLVSTSGYENIDNRMLEAVNLSNKNWLPARNEKGIPVKQKLTVFFGIEGC